MEKTAYHHCALKALFPWEYLQGILEVLPFLFILFPFKTKPDITEKDGGELVMPGREAN